jgi:glycerate 2-kinase
MSEKCEKADLLDAFSAALRAVDPVVVTSKAVSEWDNDKPVCVIAIGKAACGLYEGAWNALGENIEAALVITGREYARSVPGEPEFCFGAHPVPDQGSLDAGDRLVEFLTNSCKRSRILVLISGGSSAMVERLRDGVGFDDLQRVNEWLLSSGLDILQMNAVRKRLSAIKGGGLLDFLPHHDAQVMLISDVPGDDLGSIGSGLMTDDRDLSTKIMALSLPPWVEALLQTGSESPQRPAIAQQLIASNTIALDAAEQSFLSLGLPVTRHGLLQGDAVTRGGEIGSFLLHADAGIHLWGGETTVYLPENPGRGGRNQHLALTLATRIDGAGDTIRVLAASTDGIDGASQDAGAIVDTQTIENGRSLGLSANDALVHADSNRYFDELGALVHTGATGTNVMDLVIACKQPL